MRLVIWDFEGAFTLRVGPEVRRTVRLLHACGRRAEMDGERVNIRQVTLTRGDPDAAQDALAKAGLERNVAVKKWPEGGGTAPPLTRLIDAAAPDVRAGDDVVLISDQEVELGSDPRRVRALRPSWGAPSAPKALWPTVTSLRDVWIHGLATVPHEMCLGRKSDLEDGLIIFLAGAGLSKDMGYGDWKELTAPAAAELGLDPDTTPLIDILQFYLTGDERIARRTQMVNELRKKLGG